MTRSSVRLRGERPSAYGRRMTLFVFLISLGAALRLTRLVVEDTIFAPVRDWFANHYAAALADSALWTQSLANSQPTIAELDAPRKRAAQRRASVYLWFIQLGECPWCIGFWISLAASGAALSPLGTSTGVWHTWAFVLPALALSFSYLVGTVYTVVHTVEEI